VIWLEVLVLGCWRWSLYEGMATPLALCDKVFRPYDFTHTAKIPSLAK
jgi:hypothetical protein